MVTSLVYLIGGHIKADHVSPFWKPHKHKELRTGTWGKCWVNVAGRFRETAGILGEETAEPCCEHAYTHTHSLSSERQVTKSVSPPRRSARRVNATGEVTAKVRMLHAKPWFAHVPELN